MPKHIPQEALRKMHKPKNSLLASEMASSRTDPRFYHALQVLPNPDPVLRKLGRNQDVYEAIGYDAHVLGELRSIRGKLLKQKWRILPGGDQPKDIEAYELTKAVFERSPDQDMSWSDLIWNLQCAVFKGFSVAEISWKKFGNHMVPVSVADKPQRRFGFGVDKELRLMSRNNQTIGEQVPDYKFLLARHMPTSDNPHGVAIFSGLFWNYTFKHNGFRWATRFVERYGIPSPVGKYPIGTKFEDQVLLKESLEQMIEDSVAVVPEGNSVELLAAPGGSNTPSIELINLCNREMSKALTSQTLGSEVTESGARATADVQENRQDANSDSDAEMVQRTLQRFCDWIRDLNFEGDVKAAKWEFYNEKEASEAQAKTMTAITKMAPVKADEFYETLQLSKPEKGDDVIFTGANQVQNDFTQGGCEHHFSQGIKSDLDKLAEQASKESGDSLERVINAVEELLENSTDMDDFEERLPEAIGVADIEEFRESIANSTIIATAMGLDRGN